MQTKTHSLIEQILNIGTGFIIAVCLWEFLIAGLIRDGYLELDNSIVITLIFTGISLVRGYIFRRLANWYTIKQATKGPLK